MAPFCEPDSAIAHRRSTDAPPSSTLIGLRPRPAHLPEYAELRVHRVAERNAIDVKQVEKLVADHTTGRSLGFMGEPRVNVLELNTALEALARS